MNDSIFWEYLEELPEHKAAWREWCSRLDGWHRFNTFYTHFLRVDNKRVKLLKCMTPYDRVDEFIPAEPGTAGMQEKSVYNQIKLKDILIYSLDRETLHRALCVSLNIKYSENHRTENENVWHLGNYSGAEVYLTYRTEPAILTDTISSLYLLHHVPFILMVPTMKNITPEIKQFINKNNFMLLLSMESELCLQSDGTFKPVRSIAECMTLCNHSCQRARNNTTAPIEAYKCLVYNESQNNYV